MGRWIVRLVALHGSGALLSVASIVLFLAGVGGPILVPLAGSVLYNMATLTAVMMVRHPRRVARRLFPPAKSRLGGEALIAGPLGGNF